MVIFPELAVCGYPPRDLVEKPAFVGRSQRVTQEIATAVPDIAIVTGFVSPAAVETGKSVSNSAAVLYRGEIQFVQSKMLLPTYDVFDELRYFAPASKQDVFSFGEKQMAVTICEDAWNDKHFWPRRLYSIDPMEELMAQHPELHINLSSSPYWHGKRELRREMLAAIARRDGIPVLLCNQVGGHDSLSLHGSS